MRRGAAEAGAIFVLVDRLDGTSDLYGPAPQSAFREGWPGDRLFQRVAEREAADMIAARLDKEKRFDPDFWVVAVETREGSVPLDLA